MTGGKQRIGLWMIGACGGVGSTVALGIAALGKRSVSTTGLVTELPPFTSMNLVGADNIIVGGHEIRKQTLLSAVGEMHAESNVFRLETIKACAPALGRMQKNILPGIVTGSTPKIHRMSDPGCVRRASSPASAIRAIGKDLSAFRARHRLDHVVVVNVASSEPPLAHRAVHDDYAALSRALSRSGATVLPSSALYALGAFAADCSYVNFTPSVGSRVKAIEEFAAGRDVLYAGRDGKTGETLLKSVLAPMFAMRNLKLKSWIGHNVLGNRDGMVLDDPRVKASKLRSKDGLLSQIVGYTPLAHTSIEYVPSLSDWKVAWDFIHFEGFLETKMSLQFVWTGSDSILAAPLVIDLARLTAYEYAAGRRGRMVHLGCFFKDPEGMGGHDFSEQWRHLSEHYAADAPSRKRRAKRT